MYAISIHDNQDLIWGEVPDPQPQDGQVIIDVHAAALNRADLMQRRGQYPSPPGWPDRMGLEVAGVISHAPTHGRWKVGDRVCALLGGGGYAERVAVPQDMVLPVPDGLSFIEAAAIPEAFATSYLNLCLEGQMREGETVFIQAGASGLGMAAIQLVKAAKAKVITTVSTDEKARFVQKLGADVVINRKKQNVSEALAPHAIDLALDCVAGPDMGQCVATMANGGRWIVIATLGGANAEIDMNNFFRRGLKLIGSTLRSRTSEMKAHILAELEKQFWPAFTARTITVQIHQALPMDQAQLAHEILERDENLGKVVLTIDR